MCVVTCTGASQKCLLHLLIELVLNEINSENSKAWKGYVAGSCLEKPLQIQLLKEPKYWQKAMVNKQLHGELQRILPMCLGKIMALSASAGTQAELTPPCTGCAVHSPNGHSTESDGHLHVQVFMEHLELLLLCPSLVPSEQRA